jgi:AraC family transcriptional regulator
VARNGCAGSSPAPGTKKKSDEWPGFFFLSRIQISLKSPAVNIQFPFHRCLHRHVGEVFIAIEKKMILSAQSEGYFQGFRNFKEIEAMPKRPKLLIKNMVCQRCILTVENILGNLNIPYTNITMGEVDLERNLAADETNRLTQELNKVGFELIETRINKIIEDIKVAILEYLSQPAGVQSKNLSTVITDRIPNDYSYLSDLFSSIEGKTIEQFFILQRMEKVKELLVYDQLSLTQISYQAGFSSVHHLSAQFKKVTGLTPSHFKKIAGQKRKSLDQI